MYTGGEGGRGPEIMDVFLVLPITRTIAFLAFCLGSEFMESAIAVGVVIHRCTYMYVESLKGYMRVRAGVLLVGVQDVGAFQNAGLSWTHALKEGGDTSHPKLRTLNPRPKP